jgi:hypothetical protein
LPFASVLVGGKLATFYKVTSGDVSIQNPEKCNDMKMLPKLMKNSSVTIDITSEEMPRFSIHLSGATEWPFSAHLDTNTGALDFYGLNGDLLYSLPRASMTQSLISKLSVNLGLIFVGVTESTVDFATKSQSISAKMRAVNKDAHQYLHTDNGWLDE